MKVFARLYKFTPDITMALTISQINALLPDEVEKAVVTQEGSSKQAEQVLGAIQRLQQATGRSTFSEDEINDMIWRTYGK